MSGQPSNGAEDREEIWRSWLEQIWRLVQESRENASPSPLGASSNTPKVPSRLLDLIARSTREQVIAFVSFYRREFDGVIDYYERRSKEVEVGNGRKIQLDYLADLALLSFQQIPKPFNGNPVGLLQTGDSIPDELRGSLKPWRLYLDVTDARLEDVQEIWTLVEWRQAILRENGLVRKRARGAPTGPRDQDVKKWVARAMEAGVEVARAEYMDQCGKGTGERMLAAKRWREVIRPHLQKA
jgi:hypothetical protein